MRLLRELQAPSTYSCRVQSRRLPLPRLFLRLQGQHRLRRAHGQLCGRSWGTVGQVDVRVRPHEYGSYAQPPSRRRHGSDEEGSLPAQAQHDEKRIRRHALHPSDRLQARMGRLDGGRENDYPGQKRPLGGGGRCFRGTIRSGLASPLPTQPRLGDRRRAPTAGYRPGHRHRASGLARPPAECAQIPALPMSR